MEISDACSGMTCCKRINKKECNFPYLCVQSATSVIFVDTHLSIHARSQLRKKLVFPFLIPRSNKHKKKK